MNALVVVIKNIIKICMVIDKLLKKLNILRLESQKGDEQLKPVWLFPF